MIARVSVILPVFNAEITLSKCIDSILAQSYSNIELIIINDGSTDKSYCIIERYAIKDSRVKIIHKCNEGVASARNTGLEAATSKYISFVDSDDYIKSDMLERMVKTAERINADIVECSCRLVYIKDQKDSDIILKDEIVVGNDQCSKHFVEGKNVRNYCWNKIYLKRIISEQVRFKTISFGEDYLFNVEAHYYCHKKAILSDVLYYYNIHCASITQQGFNEKRLDALRAAELSIAFHEAKLPFLIPYIYLHSLKVILDLHKILKDDNVEFNKSREQYLLGQFRNYLLRLKKNKDIYFGVKLKSRLYLIMFSFSPSYYYTLEKAVSCIKTVFKR